LHLFPRICHLSDKFLANSPEKSRVFGDHTVAVGVPANASTVVDVSTAAGVLALAGLPSAIDVRDVSIVSAATKPTVASVLQYCSCEFLLLLLASLLNVAGFATAIAVIFDVNGVGFPACCCLLHSCTFVSILLLLASLLC
jgi:hypothetical protein